ncbi:MAG: hypothetical protein CME62_09580 [Halobacteriovoraceae bacterium]|nr:hypothetical protein [Halobacteriovoraceae bacterium]|tara:strand:- start:967 stop:2322 length:1356 start_codon:yes stop_codon:yes gene_type:complete
MAILEIINNMSQTILIEPQEEIKRIYKLNLNTYTGTDVVERGNSAEAIELLNILPTISLIITKSKVEDDRTAVNLFQYLKDRDLDIPLIVLGDCPPELSGEVLALKEPVSWEILVKHAGKLLGVSELEEKIKVKPNYIPISINYFFDIDHTPCDVYIRIKKSNQEYQYVKRLHEQDSFTQEDIQKYISQGLKDFYIPRDYQQYFVTFVTNSLISKLENEMSIIDRINTNSHAYEIVKEHIQKVGFSPEITDLAESNIQSMIKSIQEAPKLANLLKFLFSSKISYAYQKAHLACVIGNFILSKQSWYETRHLSIFTYLSFFSDITLKSTTQMKINSMEELDNAKLTKDEYMAVLNHAKDAAELLKDYPNTSEYLELIITQHQGMVNGIGFAEEPNEEIHPIARVFIVADFFVKTMLDSEGPRNKKDILTIMYMKFTPNSYQKIIKVLEQKIE